MAAPFLQPVHLGFNPTPQDVQIAALILTGLRLRATPGRLPPEIAFPILALAGYHPRTASSRAEKREYHADDFWEPGPRASVAALYLTTPALPPYFRRAVSVTLQVRGADQGWATFGGEGTYENSHTWFEACILRPLGPGATAASSSAPPPVAGGEVERALEAQVPQTFRTPGDARQELDQKGWGMVTHGGRDTWMVHHNSTVLCRLGRLKGR